MTKLANFGRIILVLLLSELLGCAAQKPALRDAAADHRIKSTPQERIAAMPPVDPAVDPENLDRRFGIESAKARRETARQKRADRSRCVEVMTAEEAKKGTPLCPPTNR